MKLLIFASKNWKSKIISQPSLYYDIGQFRAAAVLLIHLLNDLPRIKKSDEYKLMAIKSYFRFAEMSIEEKKAERFEKVIEECNEFTDRFPQSRFS